MAKYRIIAEPDEELHTGDYHSVYLASKREGAEIWWIRTDLDSTTIRVQNATELTKLADDLWIGVPNLPDSLGQPETVWKKEV